MHRVIHVICNINFKKGKKQKMVKQKIFIFFFPDVITSMGDDMGDARIPKANFLPLSFLLM